jgi:WD40 repeat protein
MAQVYNGSKLGKFVFSSCTFPDFDKIMAYGEDKKDAQSQKDQYLALNDHLLETKKNFYAFQMNKKICIGALYGMTKILWNLEESERAKEYDGSFESDKLFKWSPRGTYLILIKTDKVEFIGGPEMKPILVIAKSKVDTVSFSPCEKYILLYMSKSDTPYEVWNFQTHEMIRDFKQ